MVNGKLVLGALILLASIPCAAVSWMNSPSSSSSGAEDDFSGGETRHASLILKDGTYEGDEVNVIKVPETVVRAFKVNRAKVHASSGGDSNSRVIPETGTGPARATTSKCKVPVRVGEQRELVQGSGTVIAWENDCLPLNK